MHRVDETYVVHHLAYLGKNITDPLAALAVLLEAKRRGHQAVLRVPQRLAVNKARAFAGVLRERRLVVKRIDLRWATRHEQLNDVLGLGREVRRLWRERRGGRLRGRGEQPLVGHQPSQADGTHAGSQLLQHLAPGFRRTHHSAHGTFVIRKFHNATDAGKSTEKNHRTPTQFARFFVFWPSAWPSGYGI